MSTRFAAAALQCRRLLDALIHFRFAEILETLSFAARIGVNEVAEACRFQRWMGVRAKMRSARSLRAAQVLYGRWNLRNALEATEMALEEDGGNAGALLLKAELLEASGRYAEAEVAFVRAAELDPLEARALRGVARYGMIDHLSELLDRASSEIARSNSRRKNFVRGVKCLIEFGHIGEAQELIDLGRYRLPDPREADYLSGLAHRWSGEHEAALRVLSNCRGTPYFRQVELLRGDCFAELGRDDQALEAYALAYRFDKNRAASSFNVPLFNIQCKRGEFNKAFRRLRHRQHSNVLRREVEGNYCVELEQLKDFDDTLLIAEWGVGDEIRFASTYGDITSVLSSPTITCDPRLQSLLSRSFPGAHFLPVIRWREEAIPKEVHTRAGMPCKALTKNMSREALDLAEAADGFCSILDLLADIRPSAISFPDQGSYLKPDPALLLRWQGKVGDLSVMDRPNVALSWRSNLTGPLRDVHYLTVEDLAPLDRLAATYWIVQPGVTEREMDYLRANLREVRIPPNLDTMDDFEGQAAFLVAMDALVAPGAALAELGGALGVPTLLFGRTEGARWRTKKGDRDRWHKSVRCVIAQQASDRIATVNLLIDELRGLLASPR